MKKPRLKIVFLYQPQCQLIILIPKTFRSMPKLKSIYL